MFHLSSSYEDELKKKADVENEFILTKKVLEIFCSPLSDHEMVLNQIHHVYQGTFPHLRYTLCPVWQEVDMGHLKAVDVVLELEDLMGKLDFLRAGYDEVARRFLRRGSLTTELI